MKFTVHVHNCTILKCLDAHGGCAIVIQDIMKSKNPKPSMVSVSFVPFLIAFYNNYYYYCCSFVFSDFYHLQIFQFYYIFKAQLKQMILTLM